MIISPSLLAADFAHLANSVARVEQGGADWLHLDVMDGQFVPNFSFGQCVIAALRGHTKLFFDVHLMISDPALYLDDFLKAGADGITFHIEGVKDPLPLLRRIHAAGAKAALAISPDTPVDTVFPYLSECDMVLVMTVYPGFGGQKLLEKTLEKISVLQKEITQKGYSCLIEADGGINAETLPSVLSSGANVIVAGSAVFGASNPAAAIAAMRSLETK